MPLIALALAIDNAITFFTRLSATSDPEQFNRIAFAAGIDAIFDIAAGVLAAQLILDPAKSIVVEMLFFTGAILSAIFAKIFL
ncbi:MAG: hypothetical protein ACKVQA_24700 [Burkholderiales bacterium]